MKLLLDECVDPELALSLATHHDVRHVRELGWKSIQNGALLRLADGSFDVLITVDKNLPYQQSLKGLSISVVVLDLGSTGIFALEGAAPSILRELEGLARGVFLRIERKTEKLPGQDG